MRILVLGAGGTGGYFGGRLAQSGADVTFLVRPARAAQLDAKGLQIRSPLGDADLRVAHVTADALPALAQARPFDMVLLSCKAYDLDSSMDAIAPAVGETAWVLPILNGLRHYAPLDARFGAQRVVGGLCFISAMKGADGEVRHLGQPASITFGERAFGERAPEERALEEQHANATDSERTAAFAALCARASIDHVRSMRIAREQWTKFTFLATLAAATCLMRAPVGRIVAAQGGDAFVQALYAECLAVARAEGEPIEATAQETALATLTAPGSPLKASMLRDLEAGQAVEAMQIVGDMVLRARAAGMDAPALSAAWVHLQAYEAGRTA